MGGHPVVVVDTNVLLNLATPVVDARSFAPPGDDPLKTVLTRSEQKPTGHSWVRATVSSRIIVPIRHPGLVFNVKWCMVTIGI